MTLAARLCPSHRQPLALAGSWPACTQGLMRDGASWLHGSGWGGDLLAMPGGPVLETRWDGQHWITKLEGREVAGRALDILERTTTTGHPWIGALSYELACSEAGLPHQDPEPGTLGLSWRAVQQALHVEGEAIEIWSWGDPPNEKFQDRFVQACALDKPQLGTLVPRWSESTHHDAVESIRSRILDGGFYVANLCVPFDGAWSGDAVTLAISRICRAAPPYGAFIPMDGPSLLCLSMERVLGKSGTLLVSEPIKGSIPRTGDAATDALAGEDMRLDPKERAEHTMIVDLVRNDLGRVSERGSVRVSELMSLHAYPTVQHLVSRVEAKVRPDVGISGILRSTLPGGSVTGAPKHAVCAHIASAECAPRGFYCGALGWIHNGDFELALPIRTAQMFQNNLVYWAGGGITLRSIASKEWNELQLKTRILGLS